uniref:Intimal thickness related receptor IRP domain-containing protein n=1 Tax=Globisporangium ultimum (strain ATCC 200006 / CBS 805.95 / DAOM BR144) TaxID=431595 RepID=K3WNT1_GLOUD
MAPCRVGQIASVRWLFLLLVLLFVGPGFAASSALNTRSGYAYSVQLDSYASRLVYLAEYDVGDDGSFSIALDVMLTVQKPKADAGRTMLHLVVCDSAAIRRIKNPPAASIVSSAVPSFCATANRTLDDYCLSFPLRDDSPNEDVVYRSEITISMAMRESGYGALDGNGMLYFLLDACETVGGENGVLRSCLDRIDSKSNASACFTCPRNNPLANDPNCVVPPSISPSIRVTAAMNLCAKDGDCLGDNASAAANLLPETYGVLTGVWLASALAWLAHMRVFARANAAVELQQRMKLVPMVQCAYASMTCITLYTEATSSVYTQTLTSNNSSTTHNFCVNATILTQVLSLAVSAEVVVLIAKGWKITRPQLHVREYQWIRFVTLLWAVSYAILKNALVKHVTVFLIWGVAWACVVFMVWYNSAFNMNMLKYQIAMVRQLNSFDHVRTPVYTKYILFRRFRGILGLYMFLSCVLGILGLMNDTTDSTWQFSAVVADEALNYCLYIALGHTFRCRSAMPPVGALRRHHPSGADVDGTPPAPPLIQRKPTLVVVMNPDQAQALGTTYHVVPTTETMPSSPTTGKKLCANE